MKTERLSTGPDGLQRAADLLRGGQLVAFPTETVYGLGGDATSDLAVARIFEAKGRPRFNPLIVHVPDLETARRVAVFDTRAERVAEAFWPGPLTLVLPLRPEAGISPLVTADLPTVAVRLPAHPVARALLAATGRPLAAPSANPSGRISPTSADDVVEGLSGRIAAVVDGGPCAVGIESTILGLAGTPAILRPGGIATEALEALLGMPLQADTNAERPNAPGQLLSHYAPSARVRLNAADRRTGEVLIGFGRGPCDIQLSETGDLVEAAANLFRALRRADALAGADGTIAVAPIPDRDLGRAINDRLTRAAAPR